MPRRNLQNLFLAIKKVLQRDWRIEITHVFRKCNRLADALAMEALSYGRGIYLFPYPPLGIQHMLENDAMGVVWPRRMLVESFFMSP
ncbi:hypothetical protein PTKIN_Ptkin16aG0525300 [Pterospermum kingtungense]